MPTIGSMAPPLPARTVRAVVLIGALAAYAATLALGDAGYEPWRDGGLANVVLALPGLACLVHAARGGAHRAAALLLGLAMTAFAAGNVAYTSAIQYQLEPSVPSAADLGYLGFYPLALASVVVLLRAGGRPGVAVLLDGALGAIGAATALAALLNPVLSSIGGDLAEVVVSTAYPVGDLLLVSMIVGTLATRGMRSDPVLLALAAGLLCFCAADVVYALRLATDTYEVGTIVDAWWAAGMTVMALAFRDASRTAGAGTHRGSLAQLGVPLVSTAVAIGVLLWATGGHVAPATIALATTTLILAAARTLAAFRQVQRLADARDQARTDDLTGLANRRALYEQGAARLADPGSRRFALLLVDLDRFKEINDALGHHVGDELLRRVSARLAERLGPEDTFARLGGDEFALLAALDDGRTAGEIAQRVLRRIAEPLTIDGVTMRLGASIGIAEHPAHGDRLGSLLRCADIAMYEAKRRRSGIEAYAPEHDRHSRDRLEAIQDLGSALELDEFVLHYQPICHPDSGRPVALEALVRWDHPARGLLYPDAFLPLVEQSGLMARLTEYVLTAAVEQSAAWRAEGIALPIAVNLSASDLLDEALPQRVAALLARHALRPGRSSWRSPRACSWSTPAAPGARSRSCERSASGSPSTTTAPATARSPTCATSPSTGSRSTARSWRASSTTPATRRSCARPSSSRTRSRSRRSRRASRTRARSRRSSPWAAISRRGTTSAGRSRRTRSCPGYGRLRRRAPRRRRRRARPSG